MSERKPTGLITQTDRAFLCPKYKKNSHAHHQNYYIDCHKAAVGKCLLMAHRRRRFGITVWRLIFKSGQGSRFLI